ncbi:MAG: hypothetical protein ABI406_12190 [Ktedonobacteraceae bacterium]
MLYWFITVAEIVANYTPADLSNISVQGYDVASSASTTIHEKVSVLLLYNIGMQML